LCVGQVKHPPGLPLIQKKGLGCVVSRGNGLFHGSSQMSSYDLPFTSKENSLDRLDDLLRRFREMESCAEPIISATKEELDGRLPAGDYSV